MESYVALLRGINVGGKNIIKMSDLRSCFEEMDLSDVSTYIQSGNVLFRSSGSVRSLAKKIEQGLSKKFKYQSTVVVVSSTQLQYVVDHAPKKFGKESDVYRYDVIFLKEPLLPKNVLKVIKANPEVDKVESGKRVLYFSRLIKKATKSHLSRIIKHPFYQKMTIRNWNSTTKILNLAVALDEE